MKKTKPFFAVVTFVTFNFGLATLNCQAQFTKLIDFTETNAANIPINGSNPQGSLISDGTFLYGMTVNGGDPLGNPAYTGNIFKIKKDGTGCSNMMYFTGTNGTSPHGSLIYDGTFLYGMTQGDGTSTSYGNVFKIKPDGTGFVNLINFDGTNANGQSPYGSLIFVGTTLYGMTSYKGTNDYGTIFKINTDGTGYVTLFNFNDGANGNSPYGSLISDGTFLYGMTRDGGVNEIGNIFKIKLDGTGYVDLYNFNNRTYCPSCGNTPWGSLVSDSTFLYGMTQLGGTSNDGIIFKIKTDGTGYSKLLDFNGTNGSSPHGDLIYNGTFLYGMTYSGGANNHGTIFKIKTDGTGYSDLFDFLGAVNGSGPEGNLMSDGTFFYGMTTGGGANGLGVVFKYKYCTIGCATGIDENNTKTDVNVFPNPTNGIINIQLGQVEKAQIKITDVLGNSVYQSNNISLNFQIDLSNQPNGIYFISIQTNEGIVNKKIVISH